MINSIAVTAQTVTPTSSILFTSNPIFSNRSCGCNGGWLYHNEGSGQFTIINRNSCCGLYEIQFNMNVSAAAAGAVPFVIKLNGEALGGSEMDYTVVTANVYQSVSANRVIRVPNGSSATITVSNIGTIDALVKDASIIIKKLA